MTETGLTKGRRITTFVAMTKGVFLAGLALGTGGCVNVSAPDKPIEINLTVKVTQEVVVRLDGEAKSLIQQNPGIF